MVKKIALAILLAGAALYAQTTTGRISGTVADSSGAVVPGASVTVLNEGTGLTWKARANERGFYVALQLPVGTYSVEAEFTGFQKARKTGYALDADSRLTADFVLSPGQLTESVVITDVAGETVNTTSGEIGRVIDGNQVQELALNGRNYMQLVTLIPGVALLNEDQMALTTSLSTSEQVVNGNRGNSNLLSVDGGYNMDSGSNASQINNVGVDFIKEVKVQTSNFSAEYGRQSGASINVVTKSGENAFHGSLFETLRNDKLDARNFFAPRKGKLQFNNYGWSLGGPIQRNKLFFFGGQEYKSIRRDAEPVRRSLPLHAERNGDFSGKSTLYYPGTKTPVPGKNIGPLMTAEGRSIARVFDGLEKMASSYSDTAGGNNAIYQVSNPFDAREDMVRLDYRLNDKHSFYVRYLHDSYDLVDPFGTGSGSQLPSTPTNNQRPGTSAQFAHTAVLGARLINEAKINSVWSRQIVVPTGDSWKRETYGFTYPQLYPGGMYPDGIPAIEISGLSYLKGPSFAAISGFTDIAIHDNLTYIRGAHTFKTGVMIIRDRKDQNGKSSYTGKAEFNNSGNPITTGNPTADAMLGNFRVYSEANQDPVGFFRYSQVEGFVMDSWKLTRRLSLESGVRYQWAQPGYTQANNVVNFDPSRYDPAKAVTVLRTGFIVPGSGDLYNGLVRAGSGVPSSELGRVPGANSADVLAVPMGAARGFYEAEHRFAPRFGFAFQPGRGNRTTVRGGFGTFFNRPEMSIITPALLTPPYLKTAQIENGNLANPSGGTAAALSPMDAIQAIDPRLKTSYTMNFSLSVQRELPRGVFVEAAYVGNLGRHLMRQPDLNQPTFADYMAIAPIPKNDRPPVNAFRRYRGFSEINMRISDSNSNYNALQLYATKRKGNLVMTTSYTWSKALADASKNSEDPEDPFNRKFNYGPATFDRRQIFLTTFTYRVPMFNSLRGVPGAALKGWEMSGIVRAQSGPQLTVTCDSVAGVRRADYLGGLVDLPSDQRDPNHWFNTAAFVAAPAERRGTAGVGILRGPGLYVWDSSIRKVFRINERFRLRFQADLFNAFNHANFRNLSSKTSSKNFGQVAEAGPGRNIQFGLKLNF
jgi:hypothetical protein